MVRTRRSRERGNANVKFLITIVIIGCIAYAGYLYVPIALQSYQIKDLMQHNVDVAVAQGYKADWVGSQLAKNGAEYGIPSNAKIVTALRDNRIEVRVHFKTPIEFPGYVYEYEFDHTAVSTAFFNVK
jgi:hypothetical protein